MLRRTSGRHFARLAPGMGMMWLMIGGLVVVGSLLAVSYLSLATFFRVHARALEKQAERESIPAIRARKKTASVGK